VLAATAALAKPALAAPLSLETAVKAAFLYKFAAFVQWPPDSMGAPGDPARLCIAGADPFGPALDQLVRGQQIEGHPITVVRIDAPQPNVDCAILFAAGSPRQPISEELNAVRGRPVLTVTDGASGAADQGEINFVMQEGRVRFQINGAAASQSGLAISSKLLNLAVKSGAAP
jgi:hypothetical protein